MREDEDHFRQYMPMLRRIIILAAVLTAIPVVMWTITAFVRTYVEPPKAPTFRPLAASRISVAPDEADAAPAEQPTVAAQDVKAGPISAGLDAKTAAIGSAGNVPALSPNGADVQAGAAVESPGSGGMPAGTKTNPAPIVVASTTAADRTKAAAANPSGNALPSAAPSDPMPFTAQQPAATNWPAPPSVDTGSVEGEPIAGTVPLPRKRPRSFVVAQSGVPLPQPRPDAAGPGAPEAPPSPLGWLHNIFQPPAVMAAPPADDTGGYVETPH